MFSRHSFEMSYDIKSQPCFVYWKTLKYDSNSIRFRACFFFVVHTQVSTDRMICIWKSTPVHTVICCIVSRTIYIITAMPTFSSVDSFRIVRLRSDAINTFCYIVISCSEFQIVIRFRHIYGSYSILWFACFFMKSVFNAIFINLENRFIELMASSHNTRTFIRCTYISQLDRCTDTSYFRIRFGDIPIILTNLIICK